jgi:hypothetical protein
MKITPLSDELIEGGYRVLFSAENAVKIPVQGAMWVYRHEQNEWQYLLVTPLVDTLGLEAVKKMPQLSCLRFLQAPVLYFPQRASPSRGTVLELSCG